MRVLDIAIKDLRQVFGDRRVLLFMLAMPLVFTLFMGFAYRGSGDAEAAAQAEPLRLGWTDDDGGLLATDLRAMLAALDGVALVDVSAEQAGTLVRDGDVAGALVVPAGYSTTRAGPGGAETAPGLVLYADESTAGGRSISALMRGPVLRLESAAETARLATEVFSDPAQFEPALRDALTAWDEANGELPLRVEMAVAEAVEPWYGDNPYNQASPGILVQFAIMALVQSANVLLEERTSRTLARMTTTSLSRAQILTGHALGMFGVAMVQVLALIVFAQVVLGVDYARTPGATLLLTVAVALWVAGLGLLIGVLARDDSQVVLLALLAMFVFSGLGGTWVPLEVTGGTVAAIGRMLPSGQAMIGYQNLLLRGQGLDSVITPALVILAWALAFAVLAVWRFRHER